MIGFMKVIPIVPAPQDEEEGQSLYASEQKIYPRSVTGLFARWRWAFVWLTQIVFYGLPWVQWNDRQGVLFDLASRRFYIFGYVLYPQDFIYLTGLLVVSALSLFLFTAIAGRLWCGFACPQTVASRQAQASVERQALVARENEHLRARVSALESEKAGGTRAAAECPSVDRRAVAPDLQTRRETVEAIPPAQYPRPPIARGDAAANVDLVSLEFPGCPE